MAVSSLMVPLGAQAPGFSLPDTSGTMTGLGDFAAAPALLVAFLCNHCPYVRHVETALGALLSHYPDLAVVGICTNDADAYPGDRPDELAGQARRAGWTFPYLVDADQQAGRAYHAACTPDFFLYDSARRLAYRGAFDQSTPGNGKPVTGELLRAAIELTLAGQPVPEPHRPSMGCSIKWRHPDNRRSPSPGR
jgi:peroxiredoxin